MKKIKQLLTATLLLSALSLSLTQCDSGFELSGGKLYNFDDFAERHNRMINLWVEDQIKETKEDGQKLDAELNALLKKENAETEEIQKQIRKKQRSVAANQRELEKFEFRKSLGGYFSFKTIEDLPADLKWETGMNEPEIGDPKATKGGTYNTFINNFPATLRPFGPESNHSFRGEIYDNIGISLIGIHPVTKNPIPGLANQWALSADKRTVFYKLDPEATYSNGKSVNAIDFMANIYVRVSQNVNNPFSRQYYKEQIANLTIYDG